MSERKVAIHWRVLKTNETGHGEPMDESAAKAWIENWRALYHGIVEHWVEAVSERDAVP